MLEKIILSFKKIMIDTSSISHNKNKLSEVLHPVGSIYCTSENENPEKIFGGKWELVDKEFKYTSTSYNNQTSNTPEFTMNTSNLSNYSFVAIRLDHQIYFRFTFNIKTAITDSTVELGTINFKKLGLNTNDGAFSRNILLYSDGGNGIAMTSFGSTGVIATVDCIREGGGSIPTGQNLQLDYTWLVPWDRIDDSACDKFYWKRIS